MVSPRRNVPAGFGLRLTARMDGDTLLGGEPFQLVRLKPESAARIRAWEAGEPVGDGGALARDLVMANLAQPLPPPLDAKVSVVIPTRDREVLPHVDADEVIVVDDASTRPVPGALRREVRGGAAAARNDGLRAARNEIVALLDSDTVPQPGWLEPLLAHFNDPEVDIVAPRIVPLRDRGYEATTLAARPRAGRGAGGALRARAVRARRGAARPEPRALRRDAHARGRGRRAGVAHPVRPVRAELPRRPRAPHRAARVARPPRLLRQDRRGDRAPPPGAGPPAARLPVDDRRLGRRPRRAPVDGGSDHRGGDDVAGARGAAQDRGRARRPRHAASPAASSPTPSPATGGRSPSPTRGRGSRS